MTRLLRVLASLFWIFFANRLVDLAFALNVVATLSNRGQRWLIDTARVQLAKANVK